MNIKDVSIPGYRLNEYQVVIPLNESLRERIADIRRSFSDKYKCETQLLSRPHILLARFVTWSMMEDRIRNRFRQIALGVCPFKIELKDFGSYPSHTIFIRVETRIPVQELSRNLRTVQKLMKADPEQEPHFLSDPHIGIARKLKPWQFEQGWAEYSRLHFSAKTIADGMLLLKRAPGEKAFQIAERFEFKNLPVAVRQGELLF